jgi:hypothetical protein
MGARGHVGEYGVSSMEYGERRRGNGWQGERLRSRGIEQRETGNRIGSCGYFVRRRANHGRGTIHRALRLGGRGGATPLPSAALRRPPANFPVSGFPLSSCLKVGSSIPARPRPTKDGRPYPMQCHHKPEHPSLWSTEPLWPTPPPETAQAPILNTPYSILSTTPPNSILENHPPTATVRPCPSHS